MPRTKADRDADRAAAPTVLAELREVVADNRAALAALPAKASRNPAQKRDAGQYRSLIALARALIISMGAGSADDRGATPQ
jgi:hypothetical protein